MEFFAKNSDFKLLTILTKNSIFDVWQGSEYTSDINTTMEIKYQIFKGKITTL